MPKKKSPNSVRLRNSTAEFLTFAYQTGGDGVEVRVENGTIWLSQKNMGDLFMTSSDNIGLHLKNIFKEGELIAALVTEEFSVTATDGKNYTVRHYNLDAIIAVGYRVNSKRATAFRQWATGVLRDYTLRGYVLVHLKNIYAENELAEVATANEFLAVQTEGKRQVQRSILHYNLDAIIAVGYRVNSKRATAFRQWATGVLRDYTLRGYVLVHLKNIYAENELAEVATANEFLAVQTEGKRQVQRSILHYTKIRLRLDFWKVARQRPVSGSAPASGAVGCAPRPKWRAFTGLRPHFFRS